MLSPCQLADSSFENPMSSWVVQTATTRVKDFGLGLLCVEGVHVFLTISYILTQYLLAKHSKIGKPSKLGT